MMTAASSAMTMIARRVAAKSMKYFANGLIESRGDQHFADAAKVTATRKSRAPCVSCGGKTNVSQSSRNGSHVSASYCSERDERDAGATREVSCVSRSTAATRRARPRGRASQQAELAERQP